MFSIKKINTHFIFLLRKDAPLLVVEPLRGGGGGKPPEPLKKTFFYQLKK